MSNGYDVTGELIPMSASDMEWVREYLREIEPNIHNARYWRVVYWSNQYGSATEIQPMGVNIDEHVPGFQVTDVDGVEYWSKYLREKGFPVYMFE
ncbi:hypothetical protein [Bacillus phage CP-51]|uniref:Uncharacterized protein n=1 Tax=Bacillus phage CP-51 TaxID=1391188 RepID=A0A068EPF4_9CAUD|nr:hypothetical protein OZ73_gp169 [Bacillus phage CP-51]AID50604.1 hypothetical protein [Bacillus phage CP-51]